MTMPSPSKQVSVTECERKFLVNEFRRTHVWERELLILQWYEDESNSSLESKLKCVLDMGRLSQTWVQVSKQRQDLQRSDKTVTYLDSANIQLKSLLGRPFIMKRRSIHQQLHLDHFLISNGQCTWLLEDENNDIQAEDLNKLGISLGAEVTADFAYRNLSMACTFDHDKLHLTHCFLASFR